jgi:hypothetical protein
MERMQNKWVAVRFLRQPSLLASESVKVLFEDIPSACLAAKPHKSSTDNVLSVFV